MNQVIAILQLQIGMMMKMCYYLACQTQMNQMNQMAMMQNNMDEQNQKNFVLNPDQKPLIDKLNIITKDMDNIKKKLDEKTNKLDKLKRKNKYFEGELTGTEKKKAEREIVLDNCKEVDNQGLIINDIHLNIQQTGDHLVDINNELNDQGEIIDRVHGKVLDTKEKIGKTGKVMSKIEFRNQCMKVVTLIAVIVIGIFDVVWVGYLIYRRYG